MLSLTFREHQDPSQLLVQDPSYFTSFSLIIAANQPPGVLRPLAELAWGQESGTCVPLMSVRGAGMAGEVRIQIKEMGGEHNVGPKRGQTGATYTVLPCCSFPWQ